MSGTQQPVTTSGRRPRRDRDAPGWWIYQGTGRPHGGISRLPAPPRWRTFQGGPIVSPRLGDDPASGRHLGVLDHQPSHAYHFDVATIEMVNAALYLRRPLLVTGRVGTGKSTLAYSVAHELRLGPVLYWPITSRSLLRDGLYRYDAIGRLQEANLAEAGAGNEKPGSDIGRFIRLGPLGSALLPQARPRVLLIDELDKGDIDLPSDLLNVLEGGRFDIDELVRLSDEQAVVEVLTEDSPDRVAIEHGRVRCNAFPAIFITSNGEREFPPAFLRRCLRLDLQPPDRDRLARIVAAQLGPDAVAGSHEVIDEFLDRRERRDLATDQLLNAIFLVTSGAGPPEGAHGRLLDAVLRPLDEAGPVG